MALQAIIMNDGNTYDVIIIGGGPAAFSAAIFLRNGNYKVGYIEKNIPGGKLVNINNIENYPGYKSINGADLALNMYEQVDALGVDSIYGEVIQISKYNDYHVIYTNDGKTRYTKVLIIATGTSMNELSVANYQKFLNKGISHCATCDGALTKGKDVAIIGSSAAIVANAIYLANICKKVYLLNEQSSLDVNEKLMSSLNKLTNIEIINNAKVIELNGNDLLESIKLDNNQKIDVSFLFVYTGVKPNTSLLSSYDVLDKKGYVVVNEKMETSIPGLYAIGDVTNREYKLITIAVAQGTIAAMEAMKYMSNKK